MKKLLLLLGLIVLFSCEQKQCKCEMDFTERRMTSKVFYSDNCLEWDGKIGTWYDENNQPHDYVFRCSE